MDTGPPTRAFPSPLLEEEMPGREHLLCLDVRRVSWAVPAQGTPTLGGQAGFGWFWSQALLDASVVSTRSYPNIPDWQRDRTDADGRQPQTRHSTCTSLPSSAEQEGFVLISCSSSRVSIRVGRAGGAVVVPFSAALEIDKVHMHTKG